MSTVKPGDMIAVYRGSTLYHAPADMSTVQDTDLILVQRGSVPYKCTFADWKASQKKAPVIGGVTLADSPEAGRFTSGTFATTVTMTDDGAPASNKGLKGYVEGSFTTQLVSTNTITAIHAGTAGHPGTLMSRNPSEDPHQDGLEDHNDGLKNTLYAKSLGLPAGTYPAMEFCWNLSIGGHTDWYLPAEMELGNLRYDARLMPATATNPLFHRGGLEAFDDDPSSGLKYATSTFVRDNTNVMAVDFFRNNTVKQNRSINSAVRAFRRITTAEWTAAGSPEVGDFVLSAGGYYVANFNGYRLIMAPNMLGSPGYDGTAPYLTIAGAQTDGFMAGDSITPPSGSPGTGISSLDDTKVSVYNLSGFKVGDKIHGAPKAAPGTRLYLKFDVAGTVTDLQSADPGYVTMTGNSPYTLTFPATLPSGNPPDTDLPAGTTITTEVQATNTAGTVTKTSNTVTPA